MAKARTAADVRRFTDIPNVGPATAGDFRTLGIASPQALAGLDAYALYADLCARTGTCHDPCVIDVFLAAIDFMEGAPAQPWWAYTEARKRRLGG